MNRDILIKKTLRTLSKLPQDKVKEISDFTEFMWKQHEEELLQEGIEKLVEKSKSFEFLKEEEELYTIDDLKKKF
ncbi:MAG: hypothetical protein K9I94_05930 [Bacteroidales bacterium]|nr:hypothetical protein [Bacteroidales bacterium]